MTVKTACEPAPPDEISIDHEVFRVEVRPSESCDVLVLAGELNLDAVRQLTEAALGLVAGGKEVGIDWREAGHVSAGAMQVLLALRAALDARGRALRVTGDNPGVRRTLELAGLSQLFPVRDASV
jgi:anti-anti-sigma factor